jgi:hypothetical protein
MDRRTFNKSIASAYGLIALPQLTSVKENKQPTLKHFDVEFVYEQGGFSCYCPDINMMLTYDNNIELRFDVYSFEYKNYDSEPLIDFNGEKIGTGNNRIYYTLSSVEFYLDGMKINPLDINDKKTKYEAVIHMTEDISKRNCAVFLHGVVLKERRSLC